MKTRLFILALLAATVSSFAQQPVNIQKASGTNAITGNLVIGDGKSLGTTGTGTIVATSVGGPLSPANYLRFGQMNTDGTAWVDRVLAPVGGTAVSTMVDYRTAIGLGASDSPTFTNLVLSSAPRVYAGATPFIHNYAEVGSTGQNTFVGLSAGNFSLGTGGGSSNNGSVNTGVGWQALNGLTTGYANTGVGVRALDVTTTGHENTSIGEGALRYNTTGSRNLGLGHGAGYNNTTGDDNIYIGRLTGSDSSASAQNTIAIGNGQSAPASNTTVIGTSSTVGTYLGGITGLSTVYAAGVAQAVTNGTMVVSANGTGHAYIGPSGATAVGSSSYLGYVGGTIYGAFIEARGRDVGTQEGWLALIANTGNAAASGGIIRFAQYNGSTFTETGRISKAGNLLLGTTTDSGTAKLQVTGNASVSGAVAIGGNTTISGTQNVYGLPASANALGTNSTMTFELTSNTSLTIKVRGTDGTTRSVALTLAP